jgi:plastocyanin
MIELRKFVCAGVMATLVVVAASGCGGGSPTEPSNGGGTGGGGTGGGGGGGGGSVNTTTITINSSGVVTPNDITVAVGSRVTFINNDSRTHEMASDPHPDHSDCPAIEQVGFITPGQNKQTGNLTVVRTCGFHDHNDSDNANLKGRIRIQ